MQPRRRIVYFVCMDQGFKDFLIGRQISEAEYTTLSPELKVNLSGQYQQSRTGKSLLALAFII